MKRKRGPYIFAGILLLILVGVGLWQNMKLEYAYIPPDRNTMNETRIQAKGNRKESKQTNADRSVQAYDLWGQTIVGNDASEADGAVPLDEDTLRLGREMFYKETFGNEVFLTDIMDGALTMPNMAKAIAALRGQGTNNLRVKLDKDVIIDSKIFKKGEFVDTGIDVPKGAFAPLGMPVTMSEGKVRVGISCAACHATVDPKTKQILEGVPNTDLNSGLILALASNSTAFFTHANVQDMTKYLEDQQRTVRTTNGDEAALPDPQKLEAAVDATFAKWPKGNFDSTIDLKSNVAQIPDSFTKGDFPYGWSGFAAAGPFHGLSAFSNNVHAQNSDSLAQADASPALFGIDKEVYLATILQNAADPKYRYDPNSKLKPSRFFANVDPTPGVPGVNEMIKPPSFPKVNLLAPDGLFVSSPGYKTGEQVNAISAWQNTLKPPKPRIKASKEALKEGRKVFVQAKCLSCHAGASFTNNRIIRSDIIGTDSSRAGALKATEKLFGETSIYSFDTPVPLPENPRILRVPVEHLDPEQLKLAFAHGDSPGGYKVKGLIGLYWTAPYLHDGGVAMGTDLNKEVGVPGTIMKGVTPDPYNSLKALLDRRLREKVVKANQASADLQELHVQGIGHEYWVDQEAGFTDQQQDHLIRYLLHLQLD